MVPWTNGPVVRYIFHPCTAVKQPCFVVSEVTPGKKTMTKEQKQTRVTEWQHLKQEESFQLQEESRKFSDIILVPNVDVYRNLPSQLLEFYRWYGNHAYFNKSAKVIDYKFENFHGTSNLSVFNFLFSRFLGRGTL